eukprot:gene29427-33232_t
MTWLADHWLDVLGWGGSALLVFSLLQARVLRFRTLNLVACLILLVFNAFLGVWPMVGMNAVLAVINLVFIVRLTRERHDEAAFEVVQVGLDDEYLRHVLRTHEADIRKFQPDFGTRPDEGQHAFVIVKLDETVGVVLLRGDGNPTYMLAVVVDDHDMGVTHIIRGDDHLINAARQKQIYDALGWTLP